MNFPRTMSRAFAAAASTLVVFVPTPASAWTISVNGSTCSAPTIDSAGNVSINCSGGGTPTSCTVSPGAQSLGSAGGAISTLTAQNCGTGSWTSSRAGFTQSASCGTGATCVDTLPANASTSAVSYTYTFTGTSGNGSASVTQAGNGGVPPVTGNISCTNIPGITSTKVIPLAWVQVSGIITTAAQGGFAPNQALVFAITPPLGKSSLQQLGNLTIVPSDGNAYNSRLVSLSDTPCDFSGKLGNSSIKRGTDATLYFTVGGYPRDKYGRVNTANADLTGGQTYYLTVIPQDTVGGSNTCTSSQCNVNYKLNLPPNM